MTLQLPPDVLQKLATRAAESGTTVEQYAISVLRAHAEHDNYDPELEQLLLDRLNDPRPNVEFNDAFKADFLAQVRQRREQQR